MPDSDSENDFWVFFRVVTYFEGTIFFAVRARVIKAMIASLSLSFFVPCVVESRDVSVLSVDVFIPFEFLFIMSVVWRQ